MSERQIDVCPRCDQNQKDALAAIEDLSAEKGAMRVASALNEKQQARIAELERERDKLQGALESSNNVAKRRGVQRGEFLGWLQRYQPPGGPPPGAGYIQARWIVTELGRERDVWKGAAEQAVVELERERGGIAELLVDIGILEEGGNVEDAIAEGFANASRRENELEADRDALKCQVKSLLGNEVAAAEAEMKADELGAALQQLESLARRHGGLEIIPLADGNLELQGDDEAALGVGATLAEALIDQGTAPSQEAK